MGIRERKEREFNRRESEIFQAAFDHFSEQGLDTVTIEMIAESAEIGKGTVYKHFKSKDEIFVALFIKHSEELVKKLIKTSPLKNS